MLQMQTLDGEWIDAVPIPDTVIVNIGNLMERCTSDRLAATVI